VSKADQVYLIVVTGWWERAAGILHERALANRIWPTASIFFGNSVLFSTSFFPRLFHTSCHRHPHLLTGYEKASLAWVKNTYSTVYELLNQK